MSARRCCGSWTRSLRTWVRIDCSVSFLSYAMSSNATGTAGPKLLLPDELDEKPEDLSQILTKLIDWGLGVAD